MNVKLYFFGIPMVWLLVANLFANVPNYIDINGPFYVAVGKSNVVYSVSYECNGNITSSTFEIKDGDTVLVTGDVDTELTIEKMPKSQKELKAIATIYYSVTVNGNSVNRQLQKQKTIYVRKPTLSASRQTLKNTYCSANGEAPIHWNIDDDDYSASGLNVGSDFIQNSQMGVDDDDLLSIEAHISNTQLDTSDCNLKIEVPSELCLWLTRNKLGCFSLGGETVEIDGCDIQDWFLENMSQNIYVEWVCPLSSPGRGRIAKIKFYCNDVKFSEFEYHGYAVTDASQPLQSQRTYFDSNFSLRGCQWGVLSGNVNTYSSVAEAVDPYWDVYGEEFVATTSSPLCPDIYTLVDFTYNTFLRKCISMDTFGNQNQNFELEIDPPAFFQSTIWPNNFLRISINSSFSSSFIVYYGGVLAGRMRPELSSNCFGEWVMYSSFKFNKPKILHRPNQLGSACPVIQKYIICPSLEDEEE